MSHTKEEELKSVADFVEEYIHDHDNEKWTDMDNDEREACCNFVAKRLHETYDGGSRHFVFVRSIDESDKHQIHAIPKEHWDHQKSNSDIHP